MARFKVGQTVYAITKYSLNGFSIIKGKIKYYGFGLYTITVPNRETGKESYLYTCDVYSIASNKKDINKRLLNRYKKFIRQHRKYAKYHSECADKLQKHLDDKKGFAT